MKELSAATGGNFLPARTEEGLAIAFSKIDKELRSHFVETTGTPDRSNTSGNGVCFL